MVAWEDCDDDDDDEQTREIEAKGRIRHDLDAMAHHRHLVERRLAIEDDDVAVLEVPLDAVAVLEVHVAGRLEAQVEARAVVANDVSMGQDEE